MHVCRTCGILKQIEDFPTQRKTGFRGDGATTTRRLDCKVCVASAARAYRKTYVSTPKPKLDASVDKYLWSAIGCRLRDAKARSEGSTLTKDYLYRLWVLQEGKCALSGIPMNTVKKSPLILSLDQIVAGKGYVVGNVQWVTWAVNRAKGDLTLHEFKNMCKAVLGRCNDYPAREYS